MPVELRPICVRLNELLARLDQAFERERRFSGDVAHELRTPIAELRSLSEVALKWPAGDPATTAAFQDALAVARQMECIVTSLLAITRCEAGKQTVVYDWVEVEPLIRELWQFQAENAVRKNLTTVVEIAPGSRLQTDPAMLGSILNNLLSNAVEYTAPDGSIRICFTEKSGRFGGVFFWAGGFFAPPPWGVRCVGQIGKGPVRTTVWPNAFKDFIASG